MVNTRCVRADWSSLLCVGQLLFGMLLIATTCLAGWEWPDRLREQSPLELRLDRNYYTFESVARVRAERRTVTGALQVHYQLIDSNKHAPVVLEETVEKAFSER